MCVCVCDLCRVRTCAPANTRYAVRWSRPARTIIVIIVIVVVVALCRWTRYAQTNRSPLFARVRLTTAFPGSPDVAVLKRDDAGRGNIVFPSPTYWACSPNCVRTRKATHVGSRRHTADCAFRLRDVSSTRARVTTSTAVTYNHNFRPRPFPLAESAEVN